MTLFFKGVWEFGQLKGTCCGGLGYVSCRRGESGFGHDREQGKVMPERGK